MKWFALPQALVAGVVMALMDPQEAALPTVLVVNDESELYDLLAEYLSRYGVVVHTAYNAAQARLQVAAAVPWLKNDSAQTAQAQRDDPALVAACCSVNGAVP